MIDQRAHCVQALFDLAEIDHPTGGAVDLAAHDQSDLESMSMHAAARMAGR